MWRKTTCFRENKQQLTPPLSPNIAQAEQPQAYEGVHGEIVHGRRLRPTAEIRVRGQQEAGLLRETQVRRLGGVCGSPDSRSNPLYSRPRSPCPSCFPL